MRQLVRTLLIIALIAAAFVAVTRWPRINQVETGRTPEYPQLREREYAASEAVVGRAAKAAVESLPGWTLVGAGAGRGGTAVQALATRWGFLKTEITIAVRRQGSKSVVRTLARSTFGPWDFGQGARHIEQLQAEMDKQLAPGAVTPALPAR